MTKICSNCGFENPDTNNYCGNCGNSLFTMVSPNINPDNLIIISYILTIIFSWGGLIINFLFNFSNFGFFSFIGIFVPFYLIQSKNSAIKRHGYIQIAISLIGIFLSFLVFFN